MGFLTTDGVCDNCGDDLPEDGGVTDDGHTFCSDACRDAYAEEHDHDDDEEEAVCRFC